MRTAPARIANFRSLGGLPTTEGGRVKEGCLFRSGHLHEATPADGAVLVGLGVRTIIDLRSANEADQQPDVVPDGVRYVRVGALQMLDDPAEAPIDLLDWQGFLRSTAESEAVLARLEAFQYGVYPEMVARPEAFRVLVHELLDHPGEAVLVHCTAGKDRTGVACAIVLKLLGVPPAVIEEDYLASRGNLVSDHQKIRDTVRAGGASPRVKALVDYMLGVSTGQLDSAFAQIDARYGSFAGFAADGLGLGDSDVAALRRVCLA